MTSVDDFWLLVNYFFSANFSFVFSYEFWDSYSNPQKKPFFPMWGSWIATFIFGRVCKQIFSTCLCLSLRSTGVQQKKISCTRDVYAVEKPDHFQQPSILKKTNKLMLRGKKPRYSRTFWKLEVGENIEGNRNGGVFTKLYRGKLANIPFGFASLGPVSFSYFPLRLASIWVKLSTRSLRRRPKSYYRPQNFSH